MPLQRENRTRYGDFCRGILSFMKDGNRGILGGQVNINMQKI